MAKNEARLYTGKTSDLFRAGQVEVDPTANSALKRLDAECEVTEESWRFHEMLDTIRSMCELADFTIEERIVLKDNRTGKVWR